MSIQIHVSIYLHIYMLILHRDVSQSFSLSTNSVLDNIMNTQYHSSLDMYAELAELENKYPDIAEFRAGDSMKTATLHELKLTDDVSTTLSRVAC